ncbi:hypothetical protein [Micromonospora sp. KC721]|uniref:hypothetical protein n=1 Tax=Micromonospora sp. KC721 TaxID=2530380 RepID=UPI001049D4F1|nr:hypothetical protein [Micromonospora sp. KC721]TDB73962.1 hypothetical protein E1182_20065 [Micromonospora sp. KC721]
MRRHGFGIRLLTLLSAVALAGCGSDGGAATAPAGASQTPAPGKNTADGPELPTLPAPRGPALKLSNRYTYKVQVLDAMTTVSLPYDPPPAGTTALALLLRVEADPPDRRIQAPVQYLGIDYPSRRDDLSQYVGTTLDKRRPYLTEDQMRFGGDGVQGVDVLEANTVYYTWAWQLVSENADLTGATLCEVRADNCIPVGAIRAG